MNRKFNIFNWIKLTVLSCLFSGILTVSAHAMPLTTSSILIDADSGDVLSVSNADERRYPASLTKVMTLYITFNALDKGLIKFEDKLTVSRKAANQAPSKLGLKPGEKITVKEAVMALIVKSANDCATVLAEGLGYSEENFAQTMTDVAKELGMKNTAFKNASGLPNAKQKTTARDMALLAAAMYHHFPQYYKLFSTKTCIVKGKKLYTHNHLLKTFAGADGMKTGFTNAAGYNIITSAKRNGHRVIAVTMGHNNMKARDRKVSNMMEQGLKKLALADKIETPNLYAKVETGSSDTLRNPNSAANTRKNNTIANNNNIWGVQIGAFSNYAKARNYAMSIKKQINKNYIYKAQVNVEPAQKGGAIVYRSKLIGLAKNEADKTCSRLKRSNKSCIVVASNGTQQLIMANNE